MAQIKYLSEDGVLYLLKDIYGRFKEKADTNHTHPEASAETAGFLSAKDKEKLDGIAAGATATEIADTIDAQSTNTTAAGAKAVFDYVKAALAGFSGISAQIVSTLPEAGEKNIIYLVPKTAAEEQNTYDEYMWIGEKWELIGSTGVDLTGYLRESDVVALSNAEIAALITSAGG